MNPQGELASGAPDVGGGADATLLMLAGRGPKAPAGLTQRLRVGFSKEDLRKEVIQPQVPLRLPCYDLVPITGFIFGACL